MALGRYCRRFGLCRISGACMSDMFGSVVRCPVQEELALPDTEKLPADDRPPSQPQFATELSALMRVREIFEDMPPEDRPRMLFWLGSSLGITPVPQVLNPADAMARLQQAMPPQDLIQRTGRFPRG